MPPRMSATFSQQFTSMFPQIFEEFPSIHTAMRSSKKPVPAANFAYALLNSRASFSTSLRLKVSSSRDSSWQLTPGISSIQPIHQPLSSLIIAVNSVFIASSIANHGPSTHNARQMGGELTPLLWTLSCAQLLIVDG